MKIPFWYAAHLFFQLTDHHRILKIITVGIDFLFVLFSTNTTLVKHISIETNDNNVFSQNYQFYNAGIY